MENKSNETQRKKIPTTSTCIEEDDEKTKNIENKNEA